MCQQSTSGGEAAATKRDVAAETPASTAPRDGASADCGGEKEGQLTFAQQVMDGATHVFVSIHLLALMTPFLYGWPTWKDAVLVFITYNLRMFGETFVVPPGPLCPWRSCFDLGSAKICV